ncbi:MAG TPA: hypothetical protein VL485_06035 [Ktedonobacteraceae bacterium]|nr:hypothetical protein [Ktedonobacteraceae bacterium]
MKRKNFFVVLFPFFLLFLVPLTTACGPKATQVQPQQTAVVQQSFQKLLTPLPTVPPYRCGAWASNNAPSTYMTISIFARLTEDINGVGGATAKAVVHFTTFGDVTLDSHPMSDSGGYVRFSLPLSGHQPAKTPARVSVSFTIPGIKQNINCSPAFFTPQ